MKPCATEALNDAGLSIRVNLKSLKRARHRPSTRKKIYAK